MAKYCIAYETILSFRTVPQTAQTSELIEVISYAQVGASNRGRMMSDIQQEFSPFHCRNEQKKILENANKDSKLVRSSLINIAFVDRKI